MKPFLNWAGGKRWLAANHADVFPKEPMRLVEPFVGSGAIYFHIEPQRALISDKNEQLVEAYQAMKDDPDAILSKLHEHKRKHSSDYYYSVRAMKPRTPATRAARLIYLNRTCWNGLYRVNLKGEFNVPKGSKDSVLFPDDDFEGWSRLLAGTEIQSGDFQSTIAKAGKDDLLYVDPPYTVQHNMNNFVKYNEQIFSWSDQVRLAKCVHQATGRGVRILISNADHPSIHKLYTDDCWQILTVSRQSRLAADSANRGLTTEVIISNYLREDGSIEAPRCGRTSEMECGRAVGAHADLPESVF